jgi:hypothetical protein
MADFATATVEGIKGESNKEGEPSCINGESNKEVNRHISMADPLLKDPLCAKQNGRVIMTASNINFTLNLNSSDSYLNFNNYVHCLARHCTGEVHRRRLAAAGRRWQLGGGEETPDSTSPTLQRRHIPLIIVAFTIFSRMSSAVQPPSIESHDGLSSSTPKLPQKHMMK